MWGQTHPRPKQNHQLRIQTNLPLIITTMFYSEKFLDTKRNDRSYQLHNLPNVWRCTSTYHVGFRQRISTFRHIFKWIHLRHYIPWADTSWYSHPSHLPLLSSRRDSRQRQSTRSSGEFRCNWSAISCTLQALLNGQGLSPFLTFTPLLLLLFIIYQPFRLHWLPPTRSTAAKFWKNNFQQFILQSVLPVELRETQRTWSSG